MADRKKILPLLPLRDIVVFPGMVVPLFVGRDKSVAALEAALSFDRMIFLSSQIDPSTNEPEEDEIHRVGTISHVIQMLKLPTAPSRCWWRAHAARRSSTTSRTTGTSR